MRSVICLICILYYYDVYTLYDSRFPSISGTGMDANPSGLPCTTAVDDRSHLVLNIARITYYVLVWGQLSVARDTNSFDCSYLLFNVYSLSSSAPCGADRDFIELRLATAITAKLIFNINNIAIILLWFSSVCPARLRTIDRDNIMFSPGVWNPFMFDA